GFGSRARSARCRSAGAGQLPQQFRAIHPRRRDGSLCPYPHRRAGRVRHRCPEALRSNRDRGRASLGGLRQTKPLIGVWPDEPEEAADELVSLAQAMGFRTSAADVDGRDRFSYCSTSTTVSLAEDLMDGLAVADLKTIVAPLNFLVPMAE